MPLDPALITYLSLGGAVGVAHALEADHVAAVASLATRGRSVRDTVRVGVAWGTGHALVLAIVAGALVAVGRAIPERFASMLELGVGVMLVLLGADVLRRLVVDRVHFHQHRHGTHVHLHAHAHRGEYAVHDPARHDHAHRSRLALRPLLVGMTHGLAGSAALVVLAAGSATTPLRGLAYVVLFGLGSVAGMAALSVAIALPLKRLARVATRARNAAHGVVGATTVGLGVSIAVEAASLLVA